MMVPFPAPDGPEMTKTAANGSAAEVGEQLGPLTLGEAADRLAGADAALLEDARRFHAPALGRRHEDVDDLGRLQELGRLAEHRCDRDRAALEIGFERARLLRTWLARCRASMRWSSDRDGALLAGLAGVGHRRRVYVTPEARSRSARQSRLNWRRLLRFCQPVAGAASRGRRRAARCLAARARRAARRGCAAAPRGRGSWPRRRRRRSLRRR